MWGKIEQERIFAEEAAKERRRHDILHADPSRQSAEIKSGMTFNIGLTADEMCQEMSADLPGFRKIYNLAVDQCIDWSQAEEIYNKKIAANEDLMDKINASENDRFPKKIKPKATFIQIHKRRIPPTKAELAERATRYKKWKDAYDAINTE